MHFISFGALSSGVSSPLSSQQRGRLLLPLLLLSVEIGVSGSVLSATGLVVLNASFPATAESPKLSPDAFVQSLTRGVTCVLAAAAAATAAVVCTCSVTEVPLFVNSVIVTAAASAVLLFLIIILIFTTLFL
uniref:Uncharacterized protein n=1 Tax=Anopheles melas TaxID=34690 RepID=A0A182TXQ3_9DIPT